ncbi:MAG: NADPH-dependent glutamate synthase [Ignavibacteriae bacterium]|nr:NADPH-dependent glutamate synthase [Ignavibacteriota bacterium]NOG99634.1 NADPH-dependent glutamate synthase [Ignavibacteriota bacterium]
MSHENPETIADQAREWLAEYIVKKDDLKPKDRLAIPSQEMPAQDPIERGKNLDEVALGFTMEQARLEALRCLQCKKNTCVDDCPVAIDIPGFIKHIADGDMQAAADTIKESSLLPSICGRVCPQETQCQEHCKVGMALKDIDKGVGIGRLERFVADWERATGNIRVPEVKPATGKKVAVVGSGPAGLVVAADVRREGHDVTIFEAFHKMGGVMRYGIPEFRLPNEIIDQEIDTLNKMGVKFQTNYVVGRTRKLTDLIDKDGFDAVFVGTGAGLPYFMGIEGENLVGVFSANEYLTRANLMKAFDKKESNTPIYESKKVAVLGGGNVAMDAARMALRLGAEKVYVVYRRTEKEMPARNEEIEHAKEEGIEFHFLRNPKRILGTEDGRVKAMEVLKYELGEPDDSGRRRPVVIEGSEFMMEVDTVLVSIGNGSNPLISQTTPDMSVNKWGNIKVDEKQKSSINKIYAGGDIVLGAATVILAMGEGRRAAKAINEQLANELAVQSN